MRYLILHRLPRPLGNGDWSAHKVYPTRADAEARIPLIRVGYSQNTEFIVVEVPE